MCPKPRRGLGIWELPSTSKMALLSHGSKLNDQFSKHFSNMKYFKIFSKENKEKRRKRRRGRRKRWLSLPSGKELETFIQRNFLPINVSVHPDQNLQTAYHPKPKHLSLFFSEKWRVLILVSASKLPKQWCWVQEGVTTSPCLPLWFIRHSQENRECWEWIKMMWGQGKWWLQMRPMSCFQKYSSL